MSRLLKGVCMVEELDITGLTAGMLVPNYRKMCELLGDRVRTGDAKACQLRRWEKLFRFERNGNGYFITEVFTHNDVGVPEKRSGKYIQYVEPLLIDHLCRHGGAVHRISITRKALCSVLGLVNEHYITSGKKGELYGDFTGFEIAEGVDDDLVTEDGKVFKCGDVFWFKIKIGKRLNNIVDYALRSMQRRGVITVDTEYAVTVVDENGVTRTHTATDEQVRDITAMENRVLKKMDIASERSLRSANKRWEFYDRMNKALSKKYGWKGAFRRTVITLNEEYVVGGKLRRSSVNHYKRVLNRKILDYLSDEVVKDKEMYDEGKYPYNPNNWRSKTLNEALEHKDFLKTQRDIAEYLVKI